jgi:hypothetical protein
MFRKMMLAGVLGLGLVGGLVATGKAEAGEVIHRRARVEVVNRRVAHPVVVRREVKRVVQRVREMSRTRTRVVR